MLSLWSPLHPSATQLAAEVRRTPRPAATAGHRGGGLCSARKPMQPSPRCSPLWSPAAHGQPGPRQA
eukprot:13442458-Alexandrium_andersonii.AAC.1